MRIRLFGEINPIADMYYSTTFHLTQENDIELELDLEELPINNRWILDYDNFIGNISKNYDTISKILEIKLPEKNKKLKPELVNIIISPYLQEFATWVYDYQNCNNEEFPMVVVRTDKNGKIIDIEF